MTDLLIKPMESQTCSQSLYCHSLIQFKSQFETSSQGLLIDPIDPANLVSQYQNLGKSELTAEHFAQLSYEMAQLRHEIHEVCTNRRIVVVWLRPYRCIVHKKHAELKVSNYDWLWSGAGRDTRLYLIDNDNTSYSLTDYGENSPCEEYLKMPSLHVETTAMGNISPLAIDDKGNAVAFLMFHGNSLLVFIPRGYQISAKKQFIAILGDIFHPEAWPPTISLNTIDPLWSGNYRFPDLQPLGNILAEKKGQILQMQEECENIHRHMAQIEELQKKFWGGDPSNMTTALTFVLSQWGMQVVSNGESIRCIAQERQGMILSVACDEQATLWMGKKLMKLKDPSQKGILAVNSYRNLDPKERKDSLYSPALINLAHSYNLSIISYWDIFRAYCAGRKELIDIIWNGNGVISPEWTTT